MPPGDVEEQVVAPVAVGEVLAGVVDDVVGAERSGLSTLPVLHTAVTSAPSAFAIWIANVPTPPDAPLISTLLAGLQLFPCPEALAGR